MQPTGTADLHPQDWCLIVEALGRLARTYGDRATTEWAWTLVGLIAAEQGLPPSELVRQIDD